MEAPKIEGSMLDEDDEKGDVPSTAIPQTYVEAQDALIAAIQNDSGLRVADINKYLPLVKTTLANLASAVPGAGSAVAAILQILPNQIP